MNAWCLDCPWLFFLHVLWQWIEGSMILGICNPDHYLAACVGVPQWFQQASCSQRPPSWCSAWRGKLAALWTKKIICPLLLAKSKAQNVKIYLLPFLSNRPAHCCKQNTEHSQTPTRVTSYVFMSSLGTAQEKERKTIKPSSDCLQKLHFCFLWAVKKI